MFIGKPAYFCHVNDIDWIPSKNLGVLMKEKPVNIQDANEHSDTYNGSYISITYILNNFDLSIVLFSDEESDVDVSLLNDDSNGGCCLLSSTVCGETDNQLPDCATFINSDIASSSYSSVDDYSTAAIEDSSSQPNHSKNIKNKLN